VVPTGKKLKVLATDNDKVQTLALTVSMLHIFLSDLQNHFKNFFYYRQ